MIDYFNKCLDLKKKSTCFKQLIVGGNKAHNQII